MSDPLILFVTDLAATELLWCATVKAAVSPPPMRGDWAAFSEWLAERPERRTLPLSVLLPDQGCSRLMVPIPGASREKALQALPFALEDLALDELDQLVTVLGDRPQTPGRWPVLLVNAELRTRVLDALSVLGLKPQQLVAAADVLPVPESGCFHVWTEPVSGSLSVVTGPHEGMAFASLAGVNPAEQLAHILTRLEHPPQRVVLQMATERPPDWPSSIEFETHAEPTLADWCVLWRAGLTTNRLLSAIASPRAAGDQHWRRRWVQVAAALVAVLGLVLLSQGISAGQKNGQVQQLQVQIERDVHAALPQVTRIVNVQVQLQQALDARHSGTQSDGLLPTLAFFGAAYRVAQPNDPKLAIQSLQFSAHKLTVALVAEKYTVLQKLLEQLQVTHAAAGGWVVSPIDAGVDAGVAHMRIGMEQLRPEHGSREQAQ
ncbi:MAG TPA: type II secretion system protein GspL [Halothiobacillus sp.]|nr:MAG: hypothetical protein B7Z82_02815 [Halothiobacillus sp. 20-54-6]HQT42386.1 type II secretion system protein GspL [Halothiobacillus sp.]